MKRLVALPLLLLALLPLRAEPEPEYPSQGPDIYNTQADGFALITAALEQAKAAHKHVLLDFGANWCPWCHRLHHTFTTDPAVAKEIFNDYVLVMIDVNMRHGIKRNNDVNENYGNPIHEGLPVLVVLDAGGRQLFTQESGALEDGEGHDPAKVLAFLRKWAPQR